MTISPDHDATPRRASLRRRRWLGLWPWALIALLSYPWVFATKPGVISADTKAYLYLDPGRLLSSAQSMWNPDIGMGTVTHQNIGYLFPMGPYFWLVHELGIPMWIGQRFWMGSLFFCAGAGILYCGRLMGLSDVGRTVGAITYMLTPYVIDYIGRTSALLMPWAGLGFMMGLTIVAARRGGWRAPALFAIVVAAVGGVNATSILFVGIAPVIWLLYAGIVKEIPWRSVWMVMLKIGSLSFVVSLWWASGLWAEGAYGLNILRYTETIPTVVSTSLSSEVLRGLGYWYFYGRDAIQPWTSDAPRYMRESIVILVSFAVPAAALAFGFLSRWRYRVFTILLIVFGVVFAVSAYPLDAPTPFGRLLLKAAEGSTVGLAMRSSNRVMPIIIMSLALLLGAGLTALARWKGWVAITCGVVAGVLAIINLAPLFQGNLIVPNLSFPNTLPRYVTQTADYLNKQSSTSRVLGLPGLDFGYYRWGVTMDPVWPGLLTRPYVSRQAVPTGEPASVNLVRALDESIQDGVFDPSSLAPMARLMSAGDILVENDAQYERLGMPFPQSFWDQLTPTPAGLGTPVTFGPSVGEQTLVGPNVNEASLGVPTGTEAAPSLAVLSVDDPRSQIRAESISNPLIVAGDGQGLLEAGTYGLLNGTNPIFYSATLKNQHAFNRVNTPGTTYVLTDSNARRLDTWGTLQTTYGYVMTAKAKPMVSTPSEQPMDLFPGVTTSQQTIAVYTGVKSVNSTSYGNPIANAPENQPFNAVDGNPDTTWTEGAFSPGTGQSLRIVLTHPVTTTSINLLQPQTGPRNRHITEATFRFDGKDPMTVHLTHASLAPPGQTITFAPHTFQTLTVTVDGVTGSKVNLAPLSGVGFAEVNIAGVAPATSALRLPIDLLSHAGSQSVSHPLDILLNRLRASGLPPRTDPELSMNRLIDMPVARSFFVQGEARISSLISDYAINQLVGRSTSTQMAPGDADDVRIVQTNSSSRLPGDLNASSWSAFDDDPNTAWQTGFGKWVGAWIQAFLARPLSFNQLGLQVVADGRHQIPTRITITAAGAHTTQSETVTLPHIDPGIGRPQGSVTSVPISFPTMTGTNIRIRIDATDRLRVRDAVNGGIHLAPIGIADVGLPGAAEPITPAELSSTCQAGLLSVNGQPEGVSITGSTAQALAGDAASVHVCNSTDILGLGSGSNLVSTGEGSELGWNIDQLALFSPAATPSSTALSIPAAQVVALTHSNRWSATVTVKGSGAPSWLVLGQSLSSGWQAKVDGHALGAPQLIDGYANGWKMPAIKNGTVATVSFVWAPQHVINIAEILSVLGLLAACVLAAWPARKRRRSSVLATEVAPEITSPISYDGRPPGWVTTVIVALVVGGIGALIVAPLVGVAMAVLCALGLRLRFTRVVTLLVVVGGVAAAGASTAYLGRKYHYPFNIGWPSHFNMANELVWIAVGVLLVDAAVEFFRRPTEGTDADQPTEPGGDEVADDPLGDASSSDDAEEAPASAEAAST